MGRYKRKNIGGAPALAVKLLIVICVIGFAAALLTGCGAYTSSKDTKVSLDDDSSFSEGDGSIYGGDSTYVEVPGGNRQGDVFPFSYTTPKGTELTCIVYDRSTNPGANYGQGAAGMWCFEEGPEGGMIAPIPRPQR